MSAWIRDCLHNRSISVRIVTSFSDNFVLANGTPQGSDMNSTLFNITVNDLIGLIWECLLSKFADDKSLHKSNKNLK